MPLAKAKTLWKSIFGGQKSQATIDPEAIEREKERKAAAEAARRELQEKKEAGEKKKKSGFLGGRRQMNDKEFEELEKASR